MTHTCVKVFLEKDKELVQNIESACECAANDGLVVAKVVKDSGFIFLYFGYED